MLLKQCNVPSGLYWQAVTNCNRLTLKEQCNTLSMTGFFLLLQVTSLFVLIWNVRKKNSSNFVSVPCCRTRACRLLLGFGLNFGDEKQSRAKWMKRSERICRIVFSLKLSASHPWYRNHNTRLCGCVTVWLCAFVRVDFACELKCNVQDLLYMCIYVRQNGRTCVRGPLD